MLWKKRLCVWVRSAFLISSLTFLISDNLSASDPLRINVVKPTKIDDLLLEKIRHLYPEAIEHRQPGKPMYSIVQEIASPKDGNDSGYSIVVVEFIIPSSRVDHGTGELLIFKNVVDGVPIYRRSLHTIPNRSGNFTVIDDRWLQVGDAGCIVSLTDDDSMRRFAKFGTQPLLNDFCLNSTRKALNSYLENGRATFLEGVPIKKGRNGDDFEFPDRIIEASIYPSMVQDFRSSEFEYSSPWEGTMYARIIPMDASAAPIIIEFGVTGEAEGIDEGDVKAFIWRTVTKEPEDRPALTWQWTRRVPRS